MDGVWGMMPMLIPLGLVILSVIGSALFELAERAALWREARAMSRSASVPVAAQSGPELHSYATEAISEPTRGTGSELVPRVIPTAAILEILAARGLSRADLLVLLARTPIDGDASPAAKISTFIGGRNADTLAAIRAARQEPAPRPRPDPRYPTRTPEEEQKRRALGLA